MNASNNGNNGGGSSIQQKIGARGVVFENVRRSDGTVGRLEITGKGVSFVSSAKGVKPIRIAWTNLNKHFVNQGKGTATPKLKIVHQNGSTFIFEMNSKEDLMGVRREIATRHNTCVRVYRR